MSGSWSDVCRVLADEPIDAALDGILARWSAAPSSHATFRSWARSMRDWLLSQGEERLPTRMLFLKEQYRWLHSELARTLIDGGNVDEALVSRRAYVGMLIDVLEPYVEPALPKKASYTRVAA